MKEKINFKSKFKLFSDHWSPKIVARLNDYEFKLVKLKHKFVWHKHMDTDEAFIVIEGSMGIEFSDRVVKLESGEMLVVKKGEMHRPFAKNECKVLIIEPKDVTNTGEIVNNLTAKNDIWI